MEGIINLKASKNLPEGGKSVIYMRSISNVWKTFTRFRKADILGNLMDFLFNEDRFVRRLRQCYSPSVDVCSNIAMSNAALWSSSFHAIM